MWCWTRRRTRRTDPVVEVRGVGKKRLVWSWKLGSLATWAAGGRVALIPAAQGVFAKASGRRQTGVAERLEVRIGPVGAQS